MKESIVGIEALPPIRRARGYRLYAEDGRRFLDLCQDGGRGVLGAKGTGIGTMAKNSIDKGLASPLPSIYERRLAKALLSLHPEYRATRFYSCEAEGLIALAGAILDPARRGEGPGRPRALALRPFGEFLDAPAEAPAIGWAVLPCPRALSPAILLFKEGKEAAAFPAPPVPPLLLASACKALAELQGFGAKVGEETWKRADRRLSGLFERKGPWLYPRCAKERYAELFRAALERGVLLSPEWEMPSILPADFDDGELKPLERVNL